MNNKSTRLEPLQLLRGLAAILIMVMHARYETAQITGVSSGIEEASYLLVGVDIFFVLSGFIMVYTTWGKSGFEASKNFMIRRILRIIPIYWFYTFLLLGVALIAPQVLGKAEFIPAEFLKSLFFIPYLNSAGDIQPFLALGWTLNYEMYFYALFALCLLLPVRFSLPALGGYFILSVISDFGGVDHVAAEFYGYSIVLEFFYGCLIGYAFMKGWRLPRSFLYAGFACAGILAAAFVFEQEWQDQISFNLFRTVIPVLLVALLALPKGAEELRAPKSAVLIGDSSYTLYLSHPFAIGAVTQGMMWLGLEQSLPPLLILIITAIACLIGGCIAYILIEKPLLSASKKLVYKKK